MRRAVTFLIVSCALSASIFGALGAVPKQGERPPQPFFPDIFSGQATLQGAPAPTGTQLIACLKNCDAGFESEPVEIKSAGRYEMLEVNPPDQAFIGFSVSFYLINEFGRIEALESLAYVGLFKSNTLDLTFNDPLPIPTPMPTATPFPTITPTAALPVPGDPSVTAIPRLALIIGATAVAAGAGLILLARRQARG